MIRTPRAGALASALLLTLALTTGCGDDPSAREGSERQRPRPGAKAGPDPSASPPASRAATPRQQPERDRPAHERRSVAARTGQPEPTGNALTVQETPDAHLIGAGPLGAGWSVGSTGGEAGRMTSDCQRATLHDIGAMETRVRDFAADRSVAAQAVSRFGDAKSAWRAEQVMIAWREDCADELRRRDAALGTVRHGSWLSVFEVAGPAEPRKRLRAALAAVRATF